MKKSITAIAVAGLAASFASGQTTMGMTTQTASDSGLGNFSGAFTFDFFDAAAVAANEGVSVGDITLTGVMITAKSTLLGGDFAIDNDGENPASGTATISALSLLESTGAPVSITLVPNAAASDSFNLAAQDDDNGTPTDADFDDLANQGSSTDDFAEFSPDGEMDSDASNFVGVFASAFDTTGTFGFDYAITTSFDFGGLGGIAFEGESIGSLLEVTVKYTYEVVPTPGSAAVLGLGGLVAMRRRR